MAQAAQEREGRGIINNAQAELLKLEGLLNTLAKRLADQGGSSLEDKAFADVGVELTIKIKAMLDYYGANQNIIWIVDKRTRVR